MLRSLFCCLYKNNDGEIPIEKRIKRCESILNCHELYLESRSSIDSSSSSSSDDSNSVYSPVVSSYRWSLTHMLPTLKDRVSKCERRLDEHEKQINVQYRWIKLQEEDLVNQSILIEKQEEKIVSLIDYIDNMMDKHAEKINQLSKD